MSATSTSRRWAFFWLFVAIIVVPFILAPALFRLQDREYPFEFGVLLSILGLLIWLVSQGAGWRPVEKNTAVILKDSLNGVAAHPKRPYLFIPIIHKIEARLPIYPVTFEFPVEAIDTHTPGLAKITKIRVRATCQISNPEMFYRKSQIYIDRIKQMEESEKLKRTEIALWRKLLEEVAHVYIDDIVRDVVWKWQIFLAYPDVVRALDYTPEKDGKPALEGDPYSLSRNRKALGDRVKAAIRSELEKDQMGFRVDPLVLEAIEIDPEAIKRATTDPKKEREKAEQELIFQADAIRRRGQAEAEVRTFTLATMLKVLINDLKVPRTDPLITNLINTAFFIDTDTTRKTVLEKSVAGDAPAKTA